MKLTPLFAIMLFALPAFADEPKATDDPVQVKIEQSLPKEVPVAVVVVAQCGQAIGMYATMADGRLLAFDMRSGVSWKAQAEWAEKSKGRIITIDAKCLVAPGEFMPT